MSKSLAGCRMTEEYEAKVSDSWKTTHYQETLILFSQLKRYSFSRKYG